MSDDTTLQFSEREALLFHSEGRPGKIEIIASKPMATQRDLALAYSPGVAVPVRAIADDPATAYDYNAKGNWSRRSPTSQFSEREALLFHSEGRPGKIEIIASKPMATQRDLALAYSPGVAVPVQAIADDPATAYDYTAKGNLVAVISNGTAILGLGNLGALASKPVMEGKAVLFKRFADVDSIDIELKTEDVDRFIDAVELMEPTLRRHQPGGHQGARMLHHRADAARADEHPGLPRRPARHRDHRRRRPDQRLPPDRARARRHQGGGERRRRGGDRLHRADQGDGRARTTTSSCATARA